MLKKTQVTGKNLYNEPLFNHNYPLRDFLSDLQIIPSILIKRTTRQYTFHPHRIYHGCQRVFFRGEAAIVSGETAIVTKKKAPTQGRPHFVA